MVPPMLDRHLGMRRFEQSLGAVALVTLGIFAWARLDSGLFQKLLGGRIDEIVRTARGRRAAVLQAGMAAATRAEIATSGLVGRIEIPRLGVSALVIEGTDSRSLRRAVGHVRLTSLPGESGNVALAGHRDSFFRPLNKVCLGDIVRLTTPDGMFEYRVESEFVVRPGQTEVLSPSDGRTLTLITCYPFGYVGSAPERFIVRARQLDAKVR